MANFKKLRTVTLTDETSGTGITYVGMAKIPALMTLTQASAKPMWQITKYVKTGTTTVITKQLFPLDSAAGYSEDMLFIWDNRASLTYDA